MSMSKKDLELIGKIYMEYNMSNFISRVPDKVEDEFERVLSVLNIPDPKSKIGEITVDDYNSDKYDLIVLINLRYSSLDDLETSIKNYNDQLFNKKSDGCSFCAWQWFNLKETSVKLKLSVCCS